MLVKPQTAWLSLILGRYGLYNEGDFSFRSGYAYISFVNNVSVTVSLYCLGLFYLATEDRLRRFDPFSKFLCIKAIIFFSYWQACIFAILMKFNVLNDIVRVNELQNVIISVEIVIAAVAQSFSFSYKEYES